MGNYDDYENVKSRKTRFYKDHPNGRIIPELINSDLDEKAVFKTSVYFTLEEQEKRLPRAVGYALEIRDKELSRSNSGKPYESVNYTSWTENCEESSVGRALDNAGYASNGKCSREEIEKAERHAKLIPPSQQGQAANQHGQRAGLNSPPLTQGVFGNCTLCGAPLTLSNAGTRYYCKNFRENGLGEHTTILKSELEAFKASQQGRENDVPF